MKRIVWLLSLTLVLCLALPAFAADMTQKEWDLSCKKKTSAQATLYDYSGDKPGAELGSLPKGTYVKVDGAKSDHWMGLVYFKDGQEAKGWAQVTLEDCVSKIRKTDGKLYDIHELDPDYAKKITEGTLVFDVKLYSDYAAYLSYATGLGPEPARKDGKVTDPSTAVTVEPTADAKASAADDTGDDYAADDVTGDEIDPDEVPVDDVPEDDVPADTTTEPVAAALTGDEEIVELGTYQSKVKVGKKQQVVLTSSLTFEASVPEDQQLAVINSPRTGSATLRKKAAENGGTVKKLDAGTVVSVLELGDSYTKVRAGKKEGYVINKCLTFYAPVTDIEGMAQLSKDGKTDGKASINIRSAADKDSVKVDSWKTGTEVVVFAHSDGWYEIEANGKRGFVMERFVTESN